MNEYSIETLRASWENLPDVRLRFGHGETGWGKDLGDGRVVIANIPLEPRLRIMDVVETDPGLPRAVARVVWRAYAKKTGLEYDSPDEPAAADALWHKIGVALWNAGLASESYSPGMAGVCHHADTDLLALLQSAGIDTTSVRLRADWDAS